MKDSILVITVVTLLLFVLGWTLNYIGDKHGHQVSEEGCEDNVFEFFGGLCIFIGLILFVVNPFLAAYALLKP